MRDHTDGCAKQYRCAYDIYLLTCLDLEFCIIIYRAVGGPRHGKYVVDGLKSRDKCMLKLTREQLFNIELI